MKFTFTRPARKDDGYDAFNGDDAYYNFDDTADVAADEAEFGMGSLHTQSVEAEQPADFSASSGAVALKIVNPKGYDEAPAIADFLLNGNTVLLNVEGLAREQAIRLLDYLSGATRMVGGIMTKVGKTTIVVAPKSVDVSSIEAMVGGN